MIIATIVAVWFAFAPLTLWAAWNLFDEITAGDIVMSIFGGPIGAIISGVHVLAAKDIVLFSRK